MGGGTGTPGAGAAEQSRREPAERTPVQEKGSSRDPCPDILSGDTTFQRVHPCWLSCLLVFDTLV